MRESLVIQLNDPVQYLYFQRVDPAVAMILSAASRR